MESVLKNRKQKQETKQIKTTKQNNKNTKLKVLQSRDVNNPFYRTSIAGIQPGWPLNQVTLTGIVSASSEFLKSVKVILFVQK